VTRGLDPETKRMPWRQLTLPLPELAAEDDLTRAPDGERIVTGMAAGREWWRLRAFDVAPWIRRLPSWIRRDKYNRLG
jgi:hypothetical protein